MKPFNSRVQKYFVIKPIYLYDRGSKFHTNKSGEKGKLVPKNFEYNSKNNKVYLKIKDIQKFLKNYNENSHK